MGGCGGGGCRVTGVRPYMIYKKKLQYLGKSITLTIYSCVSLRYLSIAETLVKVSKVFTTRAQVVNMTIVIVRKLVRNSDNRNPAILRSPQYPPKFSVSYEN